MIEESAFRQQVQAALKALASQIDTIESDDLDWKLSEGVLTDEFESGGVFVLSQQVPVRELWLSAYSRAWHFRNTDGVWAERDTSEAMSAVLTGIFTRKLAFEVKITG